ncbi:MAG: hybrid sensor histidine kinase/response regulator [Chloroflexota bacterium]|nr:hybrid sensor histidine kinase/response regulator [Chloroflexota bacterium]
MTLPDNAANSTNQANAVLLLIEDDPSTRLIVSRVLQRDGYTIVEASNGEDGLQRYTHFLPDLVLLDAMLPGIDGFETCRQIQKLPEGIHTPVLMVTALDNTASVDRAFEAGAVDYVTKPIHWPVLRQRVRHLLVKRQLERMRDDLTHMIVHDMKAPLVAINGYMELLMDKTWGELNSQQLRALQRTYQNTQRLLNLSTMILDLARMEEGKLRLQISLTNVPEMLKKAAESLDWMAQNYGVLLVVEPSIFNLTTLLDENLMHRVLINLLSNAIKHSPRGSTVTLAANQALSGELRILVKDQGEGIAEEERLYIFDKYRQAARRKEGSSIDSGLGLTFCKLAVEAQKGRIELESTLNQGSTFILIFPALH